MLTPGGACPNPDRHSDLVQLAGKLHELLGAEDPLAIVEVVKAMVLEKLDVAHLAVESLVQHVPPKTWAENDDNWLRILFLECALASQEGDAAMFLPFQEKGMYDRFFLAFMEALHSRGERKVVGACIDALVGGQVVVESWMWSAKAPPCIGPGLWSCGGRGGGNGNEEPEVGGQDRFGMCGGYSDVSPGSWPYDETSSPENKSSNDPERRRLPDSYDSFDEDEDETLGFHPDARPRDWKDPRMKLIEFMSHEKVVSEFSPDGACLASAIEGYRRFRSDGAEPTAGSPDVGEAPPAEFEGDVASKAPVARWADVAVERPDSGGWDEGQCVTSSTSWKTVGVSRRRRTAGSLHGGSAVRKSQAGDSARKGSGKA